ncbi:MAG: D-glucuronyl C5-epimerase family protein [Solirubrobacterales bacterium]
MPVAVLSIAISLNVLLPATASAGASVQSTLSTLARDGAIDSATAAKARTAYNEARSLRKRTSGAKRTALSSQIRSVESFARAGRITSDRVMPLFYTLQNNVDWFRSNGPAAYGADRRFDKTGRIIFQYFPGSGWQFHPLSNFAKLNAVWTDKSSAARRALGEYAQQLITWGVNRGGALTWEYYFAFSGSKAPFISSISQGTAIQSLARAGYALKDGTITAAAQRATTAFGIAAPLGLKVVRDEGNHYLGYSGNRRLIILNMFLQSLDALHDYSIITDDQSAWDLYREGLKAARRETVMSDTGAWSLYSLNGPESDLSYHKLVTGFLTKLCDETKEDVFCGTRNNFQDDLKTAPKITAVKKKVKHGRIYVSFKLSKISTVRVTANGGGSASATVGRGTRRFSVAKGRSTKVKITATDLAGNTITV